MESGDEENILNLFIDEAGEIVRQLTDQLDELHYGYDGERILDDIHRGFHTLKGGAGLIGGLDPLVECSDLAEQIMDSLRTKRLTLNPGLVSLIGSALTAVEGLLDEMRDTGNMTPLPDELRERLCKASGRVDETASSSDKKLDEGDPLDLFFGDLAVIQREQSAGNVETISDDEFESLLDNLYGEGRGPTGKREDGGAESVDESAPAEPGDTVERQTQEPASGNPRLRDDQIKNLVKELAWVRTRLMRLKNMRSREDLEKALSYLDLVTRDMERWVGEKPNTKPK